MFYCSAPLSHLVQLVLGQLERLHALLGLVVLDIDVGTLLAVRAGQQRLEDVGRDQRRPAPEERTFGEARGHATVLALALHRVDDLRAGVADRPVDAVVGRLAGLSHLRRLQ